MRLKAIVSAIAAMICIYSAMAQETQEIRLPERPQKHEYKDYSIAEKGYWTSVELSFGSTVMLGRDNAQPLGMAWVNGYRFNERFRLGVGIEAKRFFHNENVRSSDIPWTFPIYINARGNFISHIDRELVPYWSIDIGGELRGGFYLSPAVGIRIGSPRHCALVALNFTLMQADTWKAEKEMLGALGVRVGYEF